MRSYPWEPLAEWAEAKGLSVTELAGLASVSRRTIFRWRADGRVPEPSADKVAVAMGTMPGNIWPTWADHDAELVAEAEARYRARRAAAMRRYRARNPDYAERQRAYARAYKAEYAEYLRDYNRDYNRKLRARRREASSEPV